MKKLEVEIDLKNKNDFVSEYNDKTLNPNIRDYILNELIGYDLDSKLTIYIKPKYTIEEEEKEAYRIVLKKEFRECLTDLEDHRKMSNYKRIGLLLIGIICLTLNYKLSTYIGEIIAEIITIFGWVTLWELIYSILFTAVSRRRDIKRYKQILKADIRFK